MNDSIRSDERQPHNAYAGGVALLSPSGWGNLGDAAIVDSAIHAIRRRLPDAAILGLTLNPADTVRRHGIPAFTCSGFSFGDYGINYAAMAAAPDDPPAVNGSATEAPAAPGRARLRRLAEATPGVKKLWSWAGVVRSDVRHRRLTADPTAHLRFLVVAGGGQLDDFWGGTFGHPYVLWRWARRARATGSRFVILSVGTGTLSTPLSRMFVRQALSLASYRSFRDEGSRGLVKDPAVSHDPVIPDLAYALPVEQLRPAAVPPGPRPVVAVSPIAHCDPRVGPVRDAGRYRNYLERLGAACAHLLQSGHDLVLYGTDGADNPPCEDLHTEIARRVPASLLERVTIPRVTTLRELFAVLAPAQVVVASRLHGVLLAHLMGIPVAALSYERKVKVLMTAMGHEPYCLSIDEFQPGQVWERVGALLEKREEISRGIGAAVAGFRRAVEAQYDQVFGPVAAPS